MKRLTTDEQKLWDACVLELIRTGSKHPGIDASNIIRERRDINKDLGAEPEPLSMAHMPLLHT